MENSMVSKVLILGAKGMLGQELVSIFSGDEKYMVAGWDFGDIDVTDFVKTEEKVRLYAPDILINAVAYNAVDMCEESDEEYQKAMMLNAEVPRFLAHLAKQMDILFVHYSTDYVFDGSDESGYREDAETNPISRYGISKRAGEENVIKEEGKYYIIRLSKLFGKPAVSSIAKKSFFDIMLTLGKTKDVIQAVDDEKSCFTYAPDLARETKSLIEDKAIFGIYHLPNSGDVTWYTAVQELYTQAKIGVTIQPVGSEAFPRPAKRPHYSKLLNTKRTPIRPYAEALKDYLTSME